MKITVKGQVTIPLALRERFGLKPGTEVEFVASEAGLQVKPPFRDFGSSRIHEGPTRDLVMR